MIGQDGGGGGGGGVNTMDLSSLHCQVWKYLIFVSLHKLQMWVNDFLLCVDSHYQQLVMI